MPRNASTGLAGLAGVLAATVLGCGGKPPEPKCSPDLRKFLDTYFSSWSEGDMVTYRGHVHEKANVTFMRDGKVQRSLTRKPFVDWQTEARERASVPGVEEMLSFTVDEDIHSATVNAVWELTKGDEKTRGMNRFTLVRDARKNWKIISLVFYVTD